MGKSVKGHNKRNTATKRSKKFKRELKTLGSSMARGKRFRGAGRTLEKQSSFSSSVSGGGSSKRGGNKKNAANLEQVLNNVATQGASAAVADNLDAHSILNMLMRSPEPQREQEQPQQQEKQNINVTVSSNKKNFNNNNNNNSKNVIEQQQQQQQKPMMKTLLDASRLEEVKSHEGVRDVEQEESLRVRQEAAAAAQASSAAAASSFFANKHNKNNKNKKKSSSNDTNNAVALPEKMPAVPNRNRYEKKGEDYEFWKSLNLAPEIQEALTDLNFTHPTPVQENVLPKVIPKIKDIRRDIVVSSETGSGKTLLFALPTLQHLLVTAPKVPVSSISSKSNQNNDDENEDENENSASASAVKKPTTLNASIRNSKNYKNNKNTKSRRRERTSQEIEDEFHNWDSTRVLHTLIMSPTRELSEQIHRVYTSLAAKCDRRQVTIGCILGGMSLQRQQRILNRRPHILICTPGRVWDLVTRNEGCYLGHSISRRLTFLILDEADRLLQSGHYQDLHLTLDRIHCEILPSGLLVGGMNAKARGLVDDEEGGETSSGNNADFSTAAIGPSGELLAADDADAVEMQEGALVSGSWDPVRNKFIPHKQNENSFVGVSKIKEKKKDKNKNSNSTSKDMKKNKNKKNVNKKQEQKQEEDEELLDEDQEEEENDQDFDEEEFEYSDVDLDEEIEDFDEEAWEDEEGEQQDDDDDDDFEENNKDEADFENTNENNEDLDVDEEDEDDDDVSNNQQRLFHQKDFVRPMITPPPPPSHHRPVTMVTSATLTLETNFQHRNFRTKHYYQTSTVNTLSRVLHDLGIKEKHCDVFNMTNAAQENNENSDSASALAAASSGKLTAAKLHEAYTRCHEGTKELNLLYFLRCCAGNNERTIIFVNAISMLRRLYSLLSIFGIRCGRLHSSMQQRSRLGFTDKFRSGELNVLIATDIASRGLDVDGVQYVVHYQAPRTTDAYIHRCGRTARCGGTGFSLLLVSPEEYNVCRQLLKSLGAGRSLTTMEVFSPEAASRQMKDLHESFKVTLQIDKLEKEVSKSTKNQRWVKSQSRDAQIDADDLIDPELAQENREKVKAAKILRKRLAAMLREMDGRGSFAGGGAGGIGNAGNSGRSSFLSTPRAIGTAEAMEKIRERTKRQMYK